MTRVLNSNWFFAVSLAVFAAWAVTLLHPRGTVKIIECAYRVSARGIVHGPDSPFWGLTASHPCFQSRGAAEQHARSAK